MRGIEIRRGTKSDSEQLLRLLVSLAKFEQLDPPTPEARKRIVDDIFSKKRLGLFVAAKGEKLFGYALYFYTYSSFLARPTLYLEDLFVLSRYRRQGVGFALFRRCVDEAMGQGCGRMEWAVLTWNEKALQFYEKLGARRLSDWQTYRLDQKALRRVPKEIK